MFFFADYHALHCNINRRHMGTGIELGQAGHDGSEKLFTTQEYGRLQDISMAPIFLSGLFQLVCPAVHFRKIHLRPVSIEEGCHLDEEAHQYCHHLHCGHVFRAGNLRTLLSYCNGGR
jgi:hypothetical protein